MAIKSTFFDNSFRYNLSTNFIGSDPNICNGMSHKLSWRWSKGLSQQRPRQ